MILRFEQLKDKDSSVDQQEERKQEDIQINLNSRNIIYNSQNQIERQRTMILQEQEQIKDSLENKTRLQAYIEKKLKPLTHAIDECLDLIKYWNFEAYDIKLQFPNQIVRTVMEGICLVLNKKESYSKDICDYDYWVPQRAPSRALFQTHFKAHTVSDALSSILQNIL